MKKHIILPALFLMGATIASTYVVADGLTYDPYENYYSEFYGIGEISTTQLEPQVEINSDFYDPYAEYYNTYYGIDGLVENVITTIEPESNDADMADPRNFYKW